MPKGKRIKKKSHSSNDELDVNGLTGIDRYKLAILSEYCNELAAGNDVKLVRFADTILQPEGSSPQRYHHDNLMRDCRDRVLQLIKEEDINDMTVKFIARIADIPFNIVRGN